MRVTVRNRRRNLNARGDDDRERDARETFESHPLGFLSRDVVTRLFRVPVPAKD